MERFSKQNIDDLVLVPKKGKMHIIRQFAGQIIDFSGLVAIIGIIALFFILKLNSLFLVLIVPFAVYQLILFYYIFIKFYKIKVNKYRIDLGIGKEISFVFVSDFHLGKEYTSTNGKRLEDIINKINSLNANLILLGGDFLTHDIEPELLAVLQYIKGANRFAVYGNHDADYLKENVPYNNPTAFLKAFEKTGITMLVNQSKELQIEGVSLTIAGIPDLYSKTFNIDTAFEGAKTDSIKILLAHNPDVIDFIDDQDDIDLVLSGHNHAGQIYLMGKGILPMPTKRQWLTKGIFKVNKKTQLLLSQGIGYSGSRLRINTDAEICLVTLY